AVSYEYRPEGATAFPTGSAASRGPHVLRNQPPQSEETTMKYFTPELYMMGQAEDNETANEADRLWDEALDRYERRLKEIRPEMPERVRALNELLLHDAVVQSMYRRGDKLVFVA